MERHHATGHDRGARPGVERATCRPTDGAVADDEKQPGGDVRGRLHEGRSRSAPARTGRDASHRAVPRWSVAPGAVPMHALVGAHGLAGPHCDRVRIESAPEQIPWAERWRYGRRQRRSPRVAQRWRAAPTPTFAH